MILENNEIRETIDASMVIILIIPLSIVAVIGISGYLVYRYILSDFLSNKSINDTLKKYDIKKTPFEIIKEYYQSKGEPLSDQEISRLEKQYKRKEPEQFLAMYDSTRENTKTK